MKPLTIGELKALQVGDWLYIVENSVGKYWEFEYSYSRNNEDIGAFFGTYHDGKIFNYADYGTKWLAYKNKEQAETKGEWVELPRIEPFSTCDIETGEPCTCYNILYRDEASGELVIDCEVDESEAKALLGELRGEK